MAGRWNRWTLRPRDPRTEASLSGSLGVGPLLARLLVNRELRDPATAAAFLDPSLSRGLRSPMLFREMRNAAGRILAAVAGGEKIVAYGDYDVDGITGTTELVLCLRELGARVEPFIPNRLRDGYGLRRDALRLLAGRGAKLVVTADCGASAHEEIAFAAGIGLDVVVCDHHQAPAARPPALAVLNPMVADAGFPFAGFSAAGVVFYLLLGIRMLLRERGLGAPDMRRYLDLVALGTVADIVPLLEENRVLVCHGLREIRTTDRPGLRALLRVSGVEEVSVQSVGFRLGPRLNASGRLADAGQAVELLASQDPEEARRLAEAIDRQNLERRSLEEVIFAEAEAQIDAMPDRERRRSFVLASEGWHPGIVGIVASRLVERHHRPVVLLAIDGELARGSARGIPAIHLFEILRQSGEMLERYGGHRAAAGLSLRAAILPDFAVAFEVSIAAVTTERDFQPVAVADAAVSLDDLSPAVLDEIERLEPHGPGNPRPLFLAEDLEVVGTRVVGERHLRLELRGGARGAVAEAIGFRMAPGRITPGRRVDLLFEIERSRWEGRDRRQLVVRDLRESGV